MSIPALAAAAALLAALIACSAFFSASETAFLLLSRASVLHMARARLPRAALVHALKNDMDALLSAILVGNNLVNNAASALGASLALAIAGERAIPAAAAAVTCALIIFGEILPKTRAARRPAPFARAAAPLLRALLTAFRPLSGALAAWTRASAALARRVLGPPAPLVTEAELKTLIEAGRDDGALAQSEKEMLLRILDFTGLRASHAARHRSLIRALPASASYRDALAAFARTGFSRLPVFDDSSPQAGERADYIGLLHYKDALFYRPGADGGARFTRERMKPLRIVPGTMPCGGLIELFKRERINFALAAGESGDITGIITMEDLLNTVMGRLADEYGSAGGAPAERIEILSGDEFIVPGDIKTGEFNEIFSAALETERFTTLAGWLLEQWGAIPAEGDALRRGGMVFTVEDMNRLRIQSVRVRLGAPGEYPAGAGRAPA